MAKQPDEGWRRFVLNSLPRMEATEQPAGLTAAPAHPQPLSFGGVHSAPVLEDYERSEPKLLKGEVVLDRADWLRSRCRELRADAHRIRSAPFPSGYAKGQMRAQIDALAMQGAPDISNADRAC